MELKKKREEKNKVLESAKKLFDVRKDIVLFEKGIFPFKGNVFKIKENELKEESKEYINNTSTLIEGKSKDINNDLFTKCFNFLKPIDLVKKKKIWNKRCKGKQWASRRNQKQME